MLIKKIARSGQRKNLLAYLEEVKREVADVRNKLDVKPEIEREVRIAVCDVIDDLLVHKLNRFSKELEAPINEFK